MLQGDVTAKGSPQGAAPVNSRLLQAETTETRTVCGVIRTEEGKEKTTVNEGTFDHGQISVSDLRTPPENDRIYGVIRETDPDVIELAASILRKGVLDPLVVNAAGWVISGNRRLCAARMAGLDSVPCRVVDVPAGSPEFVRLAVEHNAQRVKNIDQQARELAVTIDPSAAHRLLVESRRRGSGGDAASLALGDRRERSAILGNRPLADACVRVVQEMRSEWPLSDRQIHYLLLNDPPRIHCRKRGRYMNNAKSYHTLTGILTRLRLNGEIPMSAIEDSTRPTTLYHVHPHPQAYLREALEGFLKNYWRDLLQTQPDHVELVVEKLTVRGTLRPVSDELTVPMTVMRGFSSLPPRAAMVERWRKSGKDRLAVVVVSDLDPAGMTIAEAFGRSLRDDFCVPEDRLLVVKAALNHSQVVELGLQPDMEAKVGASTAREYIRRYGRHVWELEAVKPPVLRKIVMDALLQVIDVDKLNHEQRLEVGEAAELAGYRAAVLRTFDHGQKSDEGEAGP